MCKQAGFTLLELLVALTLFSLIGLGAHSMLQSIMAGREITAAHMQRLAQLQKAVWIIEQDIAQIEPTSKISQNDYGAQFISHGWRNPLSLPRGDRRIIAYKLQGQTLMRYSWAANEMGATPLTQALLTEVNHFTYNAFSGGVEIQLEVAPFGTIRRVIEVPDS